VDSTRKLYAGYGMNCNFDAMAERCRDAEYIGNLTIRGIKLVFKYHCDVIRSPEDSVICSLWNISEDDEYELDMLEGYPIYYTKREIQSSRGRVFFYQMTDSKKQLRLPSNYYFDMVERGYHDCGIPLEQLYRARDEAQNFVNNQKGETK